MIGLIDTHAHIDGDSFDEDRHDMIQRAFDNGLEAIIIPAIESKNYDKIIHLCDNYPQIYCGMGIHPHNVANATDLDIELVKQYADHKKVIAIGEIGLDYYYDFAPKEIQKEMFRKQLILAKQLDLPVIIHNRESDKDLLSILKEEQDGTLNGVLHCFSSDLDTLNQALDVNMHISFTGNITYKKSTLSDIVKAVPLDRIMVETDSPFMTPVPHRGKRNEPSFVKYIAEKIAEIHDLQFEQVCTMTSNTAKKLFRLSMLIVLFSAITGFSQSIYAQISDDSTEYEEEIIPQNPYSRTFGIGLFVATNTAIEQLTFEQKTNSRSTRSYDGNAALGFSLGYNIIDPIMIEAGYLYTRNNKPIELGYSTLPNTYEIFNISMRAIANPRSKVAFFAIGGLSFISNTILGDIRNVIGFNAGAGFMVQIPTDYGIFVPTAEWRLDFEGEDYRTGNEDIDRKFKGWGPVTINSFYSLPKLTIFWYPKF